MDASLCARLIAHEATALKGVTIKNGNFIPQVSHLFCILRVDIKFNEFEEWQ